MMKVSLLLLAIVLCVVVADSIYTPREKALALVAQMTFDEKIGIVHGYGGSYVGDVPANTRLGIPALTLEDGPQGVADGVTLVTCWPSSLAIAASWNEETVFTWASAMAKEQRAKGTNIMLGPDINIARVPMGGRVFEMFGEDPYLTSRLVVPSVIGIQSQGVVATAKHYIDNDQEYERTTVSIEVDERTNWELYYPQYQAAIDAGVGAIMCSYNKINGTYACEQPQTLSDLKNGMGFEGWVMSDWGATHSTVAAANAGLAALAQAVNTSQVPLSRLNDMATRILTALYAVGVMNSTTPTGNLGVNVTSEEHNQLARYLSESAIALLQNTGNILPLSASGNTFAVIGDAGSIDPSVAGGGSGHVIAPYSISPLQGITSKVGSAGKVTYAPTNPIADAVEVAASADFAIVFVKFDSSEGSDRANLSLPYPQDDLVAAVAAKNPNTIVVLNGPGPVLMPWASSVKAIIFGFYPGQENGNAIANVLFGDVNPSAKLPVSFPVKQNDWFTGSATQYPGVNTTIQYSEKLLVGYRWYDQQNIAPLFPFGHGLSYSTFVYSDLSIVGDISSELYISLGVQNTGPVDGDEVVQLYLVYPAAAGEPPKVLRGFQRLAIPADTYLEALFVLTPEDITIWDSFDIKQDISSHSYTPIQGTFGVLVGSSSRDIRLQGSFVSQ